MINPKVSELEARIAKIHSNSTTASVDGLRNDIYAACPTIISEAERDRLLGKLNDAYQKVQEHQLDPVVPQHKKRKLKP